VCLAAITVDSATSAVDSVGYNRGHGSGSTAAVITGDERARSVRLVISRPGSGSATAVIVSGERARQCASPPTPSP
jgi:hypothetical protein